MLGFPFFSGMGTLGAVALGVALGSGMGWAVQKWQDAGRLQRLRGEVAQAQAELGRVREQHSAQRAQQAQRILHLQSAARLREQHLTRQHQQAIYRIEESHHARVQDLRREADAARADAVRLRRALRASAHDSRAVRERSPVPATPGADAAPAVASGAGWDAVGGDGARSALAECADALAAVAAAADESAAQLSALQDWARQAVATSQAAHEHGPPPDRARGERP